MLIDLRKSENILHLLGFCLLNNYDSAIKVIYAEQPRNRPKYYLGYVWIRGHYGSETVTLFKTDMKCSVCWYRVQAHKQTCVCYHGEEVHARKWKLYAATQDTA
jgi:hypothetical protein